MSESDVPILNEACAKTLFNMASQDGGRWCPQVAMNGGLVALEEAAEKLKSSSSVEEKIQEEEDITNRRTTTTTTALAHDFDKLFAHTVCSTAYNDDSCKMLIQDNGFGTLVSLLRRPSEEQSAIEKKCANAVLKLALDESTRRLSVEHGSMDVLCELAHSTSEETRAMISKCLYLYSLDEANHGIVVQKAGSLLTRCV